MTEVLHHHHNEKTCRHAHKEKWINVIDDLVYFFSAIGLLMTVSQILKIWIEKNAAGISALSWMAYLLGAVFWTLYGIAHKSKPITIINLI